MGRLLRTVVVVAIAAVLIAALLDAAGVTSGSWLPTASASPLSAEQIAEHARKAGFRDDGLVVAVAVALAESGGDPRAHNTTPPDDSYGLWQINMLGPLGLERRRQLGLASNRDLFEPAVNARATFALSDGGRDWTPWATYTSGGYRRFLSQAQQGTQ